MYLFNEQFVMVCTAHDLVGMCTVPMTVQFDVGVYCMYSSVVVLVTTR